MTAGQKAMPSLPKSEPKLPGLGLPWSSFRPYENVLNDGTKDGRQNSSDDDVDGLRVQVTAEPLELRRQQRDVGVVHLERREPAASTAATDGTVSVLDLVEGVLGIVLPALKRT